MVRTVIEGGRGSWNKWERRYSHRQYRARERAYLDELRMDPSRADDVFPPKRRKVYKDFRDKLGPAERWLETRVGRPWKEVEGEILATFDTRSLAGRHIVFDHLMPSENPRHGWRVRWGFFFFADDEGILRMSREAPPGHRYHWFRRRHSVEPFLSRRAIAFVGDRRIGMRGHRVYWLEPTDPSAEVTRRRQGRELTPKERERYDALLGSERLAITVVLD
ncbi:MAG: hypothetical protein AAGE52_36475 [Myxococcota bacterium]